MDKKFLEEFIDSFRNEPTLWQNKCEEYKNKNLRNKAWENLLMKYKEHDESATVDTVKKKVNSLRTSYRRELAKIRRSEKSGAGTDDVYKPSIWYYNSLSFLHDQESMVEGLNTFDDTSESFLEQEPVSIKSTKFLFLLFLFLLISRI